MCCPRVTRGVSLCGLAIYIKKYLKAKKNYGNSNISACKNIIFNLKETKILQDIITLINLRFQHKPKYQLSKILV
jgi:hypothetical protein